VLVLVLVLVMMRVMVVVVVVVVMVMVMVMSCSAVGSASVLSHCWRAGTLASASPPRLSYVPLSRLRLNILDGRLVQ
jgi:hypothetical protein